MLSSGHCRGGHGYTYHGRNQFASNSFERKTLTKTSEFLGVHYELSLVLTSLRTGCQAIFYIPTVSLIKGADMMIEKCMYSLHSSSYAVLSFQFCATWLCAASVMCVLLILFPSSCRGTVRPILSLKTFSGMA